MNTLWKILVLAAVTAGASLFGDVVETTDGARITGTVTKIDGGTVTVDTSYAGTLSIKQDMVRSIATDAPVAVRLASGTRVDGRVSAQQNGSLVVASGNGNITAAVTDIEAVWAAGERDPREGRWTYEASADVTGRTGNREQLGTSGGFRAAHRSFQDTLQFYAGYDRQVTDGAKSADQLRAGIDYQNNFSGRYSWYVRDEAGFDRVKGIDLYNVAGAGLGFDVFREPKHLLTARVGVSYRYEGYKSPAVSDVSAAGLDLGLNHEKTFDNSRLVNRVSYVPSFSDFADFRLNHESFYELPLLKSAWKLRSGVATDYNSTPGPGVEKLDTTYFSRLVLTWQ